MPRLNFKIRPGIDWAQKLPAKPEVTKELRAGVEYPA
jgi:hypothetical protein